MITRRPTSVLAAWLVLFFVSITARAQEPSIWLAGTEMHVGMARQALIDKLARAHLYLLRFSEKDDSWVIADDVSVVGLLVFKDGRLVSATKEWASSRSNECSSVADKLHAVLTEAVGRGENLAGIATTLKRQPGMTIQTTELTFRRRTISIEVIDGSGETSKQISVKETVR